MREGRAGREKSLCQHRPRWDGVRDGREHVRGAEYHPGGQAALGHRLSPDGKYLFAANGPSDDVSVVDLATEKEIARIKSPGSPWGVVVVPAAK